MGAPKKQGKITIEEMVTLYTESNFSLERISKKAGLSPVAIWHRLKEAGVVLRSNTAPRKEVGEEYLGSDGRYWVRGPQRTDGKARNRKRAQLVMEEMLGHPIPEGHSVHHKDGDHTNDDPNNLQLLTNSEHSALGANEDPMIITRHYNNFNDAYQGVNREILMRPRNYIVDIATTMGITKPIIISCDTTQCDEIDLGALGYKKGKWGHLVKTYLGPGKVEELKGLGVGVSGLSAGFDFLRKSSGNGACMLGLVISREKRKKPWSKATIIWRTTELQRRWAADLLLIHRMLELIPGANFQRIDLYMTTAYQSAMYIIPILKPVFNIDSSELDPNHFYTKVIITREAKYYIPETSPHKMLASGERLVKLYKEYEEGIRPEFIGIEDCIL